MKEYGPDTHYETVTKWSRSLRKHVTTTRAINFIDHGPSRIGSEDDPGDELATPTANALDPATIDQLTGRQPSKMTQERWNRDRSGAEGLQG